MNREWNIDLRLLYRAAWAMGLGWACWVFIRYYLYTPDPFSLWPNLIAQAHQRPLPPFTWAAWAGVWLPPAVTVLAVGGSAWGIGRQVRRFMALSTGHSWSDGAFDLGVGIAVLNSFWMALGFWGLWRRPAISLGFFLLGAAALWGVLRRPRFRRESLPDAFPRSIPLRILALLGLAYISLDLLQSLLPETFFDSLGYLLGVPETWSLRHGIVDLPENFCAGMSQGAGLFFLNGFWIQGTEGAKALGVLSVPSCALLLGGWAWRKAGPWAGCLAAGGALTFPLLSMNSWAARADGWMAFYLLLAFYALDRWAESEKAEGERWALVLGLSAGMAFSMKYAAAFGFAAMAIAYGSRVHKRDIGFKTCLWTAGGVALSAGPWFLKNLAYCGNPIYPYGSSWFGGRELSPGIHDVLLMKNRLFDVYGFQAWSRLPWDLTMPGSPFGQMTGPLLLALLPILLLFWGRLEGFRRPTIAALAFLAVSVAASRNLRFTMAAYLLLGAALAVAAARDPVGKNGRRLAWVFSALAAGNLAFLAVAEGQNFDPWTRWTGREGREAYLERMMPASYDSMAFWVRSNLPPDSRILVAGDSRGLYYGVDHVTNWIDDPPLLETFIREEADASGIRRRMRRLGVTHLAVHIRQGIEMALQNGRPYRLDAAQWARWDDFLERYGKLVYRAPWSAVYEFLPDPREKPVPLFDAAAFLSEPAARWWQARREGRPLEQKQALQDLAALIPGQDLSKSPEAILAP